MSANNELLHYKAELRRHLPELVTEFNIKTLSLFGSYVRQDQRADSDLDILVEFDEVPSLFKFIELENHLSDLLGIRVDLVMKSALRERIAQRIIQEAEPV